MGGEFYSDPVVAMPYPKLFDQAVDVYEQTRHSLADGMGATLRAAGARAARPVEPNIQAPAFLVDALASSRAHAIAGAIAEIAMDLPWQAAPSLQANPQTRDRHAYVELVGPDGLALSDALRFGLYVQAADTVYPAHCHAAEELYFVVSGTAEWQKDDTAFATQAPGTLIHHTSWQDHATTTRAEPLVAMWAWFGDLDPQSYRMAADSL